VTRTEASCRVFTSLATVRVDRVLHKQVTSGVNGRVRAALRRQWHDNAIKRTSQIASVSPRTARNWVDGVHLPSFEQALDLLAGCPEFAAEVARMVDERRAERVGR
jgi:hypothetical protein